MQRKKVKIHEIIDVNPMGESRIKVSLKNKTTGEWITWSTITDMNVYC